MTKYKFAPPYKRITIRDSINNTSSRPRIGIEWNRITTGEIEMGDLAWNRKGRYSPAGFYPIQNCDHRDPIWYFAYIIRKDKPCD